MFTLVSCDRTIAATAPGNPESERERERETEWREGGKEGGKEGGRERERGERDGGERGTRVGGKQWCFTLTVRYGLRGTCPITMRYYLIHPLHKPPHIITHPVAGTRRWRPLSPSCCHTLSPTCHRCTPPRCQN